MHILGRREVPICLKLAPHKRCALLVPLLANMGVGYDVLRGQLESVLWVHVVLSQWESDCISVAMPWSPIDGLWQRVTQLLRN